MSGRTIWITGLSGAGKSTLAVELFTRFRKESDGVILLDGDELRTVFKSSSASSNDRESRRALGQQYAKLCQILSAQGITVVIATISLFSELHAWNRANIPGYFEVYLKVPLEELRRRDPKGIYRRFDSGDISEVAGLDVPIDEPLSADITIDHIPSQSTEQIADMIIEIMRERQRS